MTATGDAGYKKILHPNNKGMAFFRQSHYPPQS